MFAKSNRGNTLASSGIGLRGPHVQQVINERPDVGWFEVHPENYMRNPAALLVIERIREHYPLSLHGVSMSLGSAAPVDLRHLERMKSLVNRLDPFLVSEHLAWSGIDGVHLNDLLPLPYTDEALRIMANHVDQVQSVLGRQILIENPSAYLSFQHSTISEAEFLAELVRRTDCSVLLDVNNLYVSANNVGVSIPEYFAVLPASAVGEIHLAGHAVNCINDRILLIDDHGSRVSDDVWHLYADAIRHFGHTPTLLEWDANLPSLDILVTEAARAKHLPIAAPE